MVGASAPLPPANRATLNGVYSSAIYFGVGIAALSVLRGVVASELYLYLNLYRVACVVDIYICIYGKWKMEMENAHPRYR